jgi:hypothetical protein
MLKSYLLLHNVVRAKFPRRLSDVAGKGFAVSKLGEKFKTFVANRPVILLIHFLLNVVHIFELCFEGAHI